MEAQIVIRVCGILLNNIFNFDSNDRVSILPEKYVKIPTVVLAVVVADERNVECLLFCLPVEFLLCYFFDFSVFEWSANFLWLNLLGKIIT